MHWLLRSYRLAKKIRQLIIKRVKLEKHQVGNWLFLQHQVTIEAKLHQIKNWLEDSTSYYSTVYMKTMHPGGKYSCNRLATAQGMGMKCLDRVQSITMTPLQCQTT